MSYDGQPRARPTRPESIAPSISSVLSDATTVNAPLHAQRGFKSRESYLAALNEFAESKLYMPAGDRTLYGWYGGETMTERRERLGAGREKKKKSSHPGQPHAAVSGRRATIAVAQADTKSSADVTNSAEQAGSGETSSPSNECSETPGRLRRFSRAFSGRKERRASSAVAS